MSETQYYQKPTDEPVTHDSWDAMHPVSHYIWWKATWSPNTVNYRSHGLFRSLLPVLQLSRSGSWSQSLPVLLTPEMSWLLSLQNGQGWVRGQDCTTNSVFQPWLFSPAHSLSVLSANRNFSLTSHKWLLGCISAPTGCSDFMIRVVITCTIPVIMALWAHTCQPLAKVRAAHLFLQLPYAIGVMLIPVLRVSKQAYPKWLA